MVMLLCLVEYIAREILNYCNDHAHVALRESAMFKSRGSEPTSFPGPFPWFGKGPGNEVGSEHNIKNRIPTGQRQLGATESERDSNLGPRLRGQHANYSAPLINIDTISRAV